MKNYTQFNEIKTVELIKRDYYSEYPEHQNDYIYIDARRWVLDGALVEVGYSFYAKYPYLVKQRATLSNAIFSSARITWLSKIENYKPMKDRVYIMINMTIPENFIGIPRYSDSLTGRNPNDSFHNNVPIVFPLKR